MRAPTAGRIHDDQPTTRPTTSSILLLRLGIVAKDPQLPRPVYEGTEKTAWEVLVTGQEDLRRFVDEVPVVGKTAARVRLLDGLATVRTKTNVDTTPPEGWELVAAAEGRPAVAHGQRGCRLPGQPSTGTSARRGLSRSGCPQLAEALDAPQLRQLAQADVWWERSRRSSRSASRRPMTSRSPATTTSWPTTSWCTTSALVTNFAENVALHPDRPPAGGAVQPGDVGVRAGAARHRVAGVDQGR